MNNSLVKERMGVVIQDTTPQVRKEYLGRMVELIQRVAGTLDWKKLEEEVFQKRIDTLKKLIIAEANETTINVNKLYELQGRLSEAKRHSLNALLEDYKLELKSYA